MTTQYLTHRFSRPETLERARYWLSQLGFDPALMEVGAGPDHRLSLPVAREMVATVKRILDAMDHGEHCGWHESAELVRQVRRAAETGTATHRADPPHEPLIHWQGHEPCVSEEMRSFGLDHWW